MQDLEPCEYALFFHGRQVGRRVKELIDLYHEMNWVRIWRPDLDLSEIITVKIGG